MILIGIYCQETGNTYDFKADENVPAERIIPGMTAMIAHREKIRFRNDTSCFYLADTRGGRILDLSRTLKQNGVGPGDTLMLI